MNWPDLHFREKNTFDLQYEQFLPVYKYASCPFCGKDYQEQVDTYNLYRAYRRGFPNSLYDIFQQDFPIESPCNHLLGTHTFGNIQEMSLLGMPDSGLAYGEVPYITPWFCPDDVETYVVLHGVPICAVQAGQFIPIYTLFALTYFSLNPGEIINRHKRQQAKIALEDDEYYPAVVYIPPPDDNYIGYDKTQFDPPYDLLRWANKGKLGWLDFNDSSLPLRIGKEWSLPDRYQNIGGERRNVSWRNGIKVIPKSLFDQVKNALGSIYVRMFGIDGS